MPAAAFAVHQLRYWLAFGGHVGDVLRAQGHSYLHSVGPWLVVLLAIAAGGFLRELGRALGGRCTGPRHALSFTALWLVCAAVLIGIYAAQEMLEGVLATGHAGGLSGVVGYGGWWAVPAALGVGLVLAALFHGARRVLHRIAAHRRPRGPSRPRPTAVARPAGARLVLPLAPLAGGWSGRGPPAIERR
jgi:hypothetical protein